MKFEIPLDKNFQIKVGCHSFDIKYVSTKELRKKSKAEKEEYVYGLWVPGENCIYVCKEQPESIRLSTLLHEIVHIFETIYDLQLSHQDLNIIGEAFSQVFIESLSEKKTRK